MHIPRYWAIEQGTFPTPHRTRKTIVLKRWGWSDKSEVEAQAHAKERLKVAAEAWAQPISPLVPSKEPVTGYLGDASLPIREETVEALKIDGADVVMTRNSYGARCLNVKDVGFIDVDYPETWISLATQLLLSLGMGLLGIGWVIFSASALPHLADSLWVSPLFFIIGFFTLSIILLFLNTSFSAHRRRYYFNRSYERVQAFLKARKDWRVRVYETPRGLRYAIEHDWMHPASPMTRDFMEVAGADRRYEVMCQKQRCFRARVSPKPWRMKAMTRMPKTPEWPRLTPEQTAARVAWAEQYEAAAKEYAACRYLGTWGKGRAHPTIKKILDLHDQWSQAETSLPLA